MLTSFVINAVPWEGDLPVASHPGACVFMAEVGPYLTRGRLAEALAALRAHWPIEQLESFLTVPDSESVALAARCIGMVGGMDQCPELIPLLGNPESRVSAAAEDALWSIWFRASSETGTEILAAATALIRDENFDAALDVLDDLLGTEPDFAEAHHQAALAYHSLDRRGEAERAYAQAIRLNPWHFAALAGIGHLCVERDDVSAALHYYRRAIQIHPRIDGLSELLPALQAAVPEPGLEFRV